VLAGSPNTAYRFRKFVRRNRAAVVAGSLVSGMVILGLAAIAIGLAVVKHERDRAVEAEAVAAAERDRAQLAEEKAKLLRRLFGGGTVSLAVLPLENLSDDPQQAYFADGMTEALIDDLNKIGALRLVSGESVMRYKGTNKSVPEIARELNVDAVLEGSVLRAGNRVQVTARLVHAATDQQLWADNYQGDVGRIFEIQSRMSQDIAGEIQLQLTPQEQNRLASAPSIPPGAHEAYLRGRHFLGQWVEPAMYKALEEFDRAIEIYPDYALAYAGRADAYLRLETLRLPPKDTMPLARVAAEKALDLDDTLAEAHVMLGYVLLQFDWDWKGAERAFKRALELSPDLAQAHVGYAWYLAAVMQPEKAIETLMRAETLDPVTLVNNTTDYGLVAFMARDFNLTLEIAERAIDLNPYYWRVHAWKALALSQLGRHSEAIEAINESLRLEENPLNVAFYGGICAKAGQETEARQALGRLRQMSDSRYVCPYEVATVYIALGEYDAALEWLNKAVDDKSGCIPWMIADIRLDPIRHDPRFIKLLRRSGHEAPVPPSSS
ncbi:MAG: tetratricopeptide repeat protein, partial [Planctomycetota bacterium]|jgi:TolB-like protein/Tfp pilus assembly protein PilF